MANQAKPNFFIIGAAKAATTSLASLLNQHPEAAIVRGKEPHFFSYDRRYNSGWQAYTTLYSHCTNEKAVGDASTSYSRIRYHPHVIDRIKQHVPDAKIIYMVRHPLERMESAYIEQMATSGRKTFNSISEAVKQLPMIIDSSRYWEVYDTYRQHFSEEQMRIVWFEEYTTGTISVFRDICRFLGIDDSFEPALYKENSNNRDNTISRIHRLGRGHHRFNTAWDPGVRQQVIDLIRDDNLKFLAHFGKPVDYWGDLFS